METSTTTARVQRYDRGEMLRSHRTAEGYLLAEGYAARTGILVYRMADGTEVRELVTPEELFAPASLGTLGRKPVTLGHPREDVGPQNVKQLGVGDVDSEVSEEQGGFVRVRVAIRRADAIAAAESRDAAELSCGYTAIVDPTPGVWEGQPYDAVQRDRQYNHVALVPRGRAGPQVRLRVDSADAVMVSATRQTTNQEGPPPTNQPPQEGGRNMAEHNASAKIDGVSYGGLDPVLAQAIAAQGVALAQAKADADAKSADASEMKKQYDALKGKYDAGAADLAKMKADLDAMKIEMEKAMGAGGKKMDAAEFRAAFDERVKLLALAASKGVEKRDEMDDADLRRAIILADVPEKKLDGLSDEYIRAYVDHAADRQARADAEHDDAARKIAGRSTPSNGAAANKPKRYDEAMREAFAEQDRHLSGAAATDNGGK